MSCASIIISTTAQKRWIADKNGCTTFGALEQTFRQTTTTYTHTQTHLPTLTDIPIKRGEKGSVRTEIGLVAYCDFSPLCAPFSVARVLSNPCFPRANPAQRPGPVPYPDIPPGPRGYHASTAVRFRVGHRWQKSIIYNGLRMRPFGGPKLIPKASVRTFFSVVAKVSRANPFWCVRSFLSTIGR